MSQQVVEALLNNETYFFRDELPFDLLRRLALPELARAAQDEAPADLVRRLLDRPGSLFAGDDLRRGAGDVARLDDRHPRHRCLDGCVDRARAAAPTPVRGPARPRINQMIRWFEECADGWRAVERLREPVRFQVHNLLEPPPHPGGFDIILCRNVLLYLSPEKKTLAFERLA